jgi:hypothetical protein
MKKAIDIINMVDESRGKYYLAVDEDCSNLQSRLESLGYKVLSFPKGTRDKDINRLLIENNVKYFITKNKSHFLVFRNQLPRPNYHLLGLSQSVFGNVDQLARTIEKAIMYDSRLKGSPNILDIDNQYMNNLSGLIKREKNSQKK